MFYPPFITNKMKHISFKRGCVVQLAKHLEGGLAHSVALTIIACNNFVSLLKFVLL